MPRLLLIDDDRDSSAAVAEALRTIGYEVDIAATGTEADDRLSFEEYAAVVLDLALPDSSGAQLVERLKADRLRADLPLVVHTAVPITPRLRHQLRGADALVRKDGRFEELLAAVEEAIAAHGAARTAHWTTPF